MTKIEIIDRISDAFGVSEETAWRIVNTVFESIIQGTERDGTTQLRGFGVFSLATRPARRSRNPRTGATVDVPARRAMRFRQSAVVAERLNAAKVGADDRDMR